MKRWMVVGVILMAVVLVGAAYVVVGRKASRKSSNQPASEQVESKQSADEKISWQFDGSKWRPSATPPPCPEPLDLRAPVNLDGVVSILYPGQIRGGDFKPHGGFRFADGTNATVSVVAPLDATVVQGSRYIEQGEVQYMFEFVHSCGMMYRFDHLLALSPTFQQLAEQLPEPKADDSRTTRFEFAPSVRAGDEIGTAIGFANTGNTGVDFGLYDLRQTNGVTGLPAENDSLAPYAVCWLDWLSPADEAQVRALPAGDAQLGATSAYCK